MQDRDFEKFMGGPTQSTSDRLYITINRQSIIALNENSYRLLGKPSAVNLYFSRSRDTIAVEPVTSTNLPTAFPIKQRTGCGWRINAAPFCRHFNICIDTTERFTAPDIRDGALHLKLNDTVTVAHPRRKKR